MFGLFKSRKSAGGLPKKERILRDDEGFLQEGTMLAQVRDEIWQIRLELQFVPSRPEDCTEAQLKRVSDAGARLQNLLIRIDPYWSAL